MSRTLRLLALSATLAVACSRGAIESEEREFAGTRWSDALSSSGALPSWGGVRFGSRLVDSRTVSVATTADAASTSPATTATSSRSSPGRTATNAEERRRT